MVWVVGLAVPGVIDVRFAALVLVVLVALIAIGRGTRAAVYRPVGCLQVGCADLAFRILLPVASIFTFAAVYGQGEIMPILQPLGIVFVMLLGFYIMFKGISSRWR